MAIVLGLATGAPSMPEATSWAVAGGYEVVRMIIIVALLFLHHRENIAKP